MEASRASKISAKWVGFVSAIWVQAIAGNNYAFSNYSVALKAILQYNQVELNNLGVAKDVGKAFGLVAGLCSDYFPPWAILLTGALEGLIGYGMQWLVISQRLQPLPYWQMCLIMCMGGNSTTWMNTAVLVTCMRNFKNTRGPVVGILKGYIGLSTAIFTDLCTALFTSDAASFVLMLAIIPFIVCLTAMYFLVPVDPAAGTKELTEERSSLLHLNVIATGLAVYLLIFDLVGPVNGIVSKIFASIMLLFLASPLIVPLRLLTIESQKEDMGSMKGTVVAEINEGVKPLLSKNIGDLEKSNLSPPFVNGEDGVGEARKLGDEHSLSQALCTLDFWLLFFSFLGGVGSGMVVINNLGQIGQAQGYNNVSVFVSLISVWGFFGRIGSGIISEHFIRSAAIPRPVWLAASQLLMIAGFILLALATPGSLYVGAIVVGICYGVRLAISVPTASELFGLKNFGMLYNFLILNIPLGSFLFSGLLAGFLYDREVNNPPPPNNILGHWNLSYTGAFNMFASGQDLNSPVQTCVGAHCYRLIFLLMAGLSVIGLLFDILLTLKTRSLYSNLYNSARLKTNKSMHSI